MLDRKFIGRKLRTSIVEVNGVCVRFFADVIGERDPIYRDAQAARDAGYRGIPVPPTFLSALELEDQAASHEFLKLLGLDLGRCLHGEQAFEYLRPIHVGDSITIGARIVDMYAKKGGSLEFIVVEKSFTNQAEELVAKSRTTTIYRAA